MCVTWVFTVVSLMKSSRPISAFDRPRARRRNTSSSRSVSSPSSGGASWRGMRVKRAITRLVTLGERSASPAATVRIAARSCSGGSSLRTNPLAPARSASYTYSSRSNVVRTRIRAFLSAERIRRVASSPSSSGMRMSIRTTVGSKRAAFSTASSPLLASATTSMSSSPPRSIRNPARTIDWSSATRTRIVIARRLRAEGAH